jgi:hypothetical protein
MPGVCILVRLSIQPRSRLPAAIAGVDGVSVTGLPSISDQFGYSVHPTRRRLPNLLGNLVWSHQVTGLSQTDRAY